MILDHLVSFFIKLPMIMFSTSINNNKVNCGFKKCISIAFQNPLFDVGEFEKFL